MFGEDRCGTSRSRLVDFGDSWTPVVGSLPRDFLGNAMGLETGCFFFFFEEGSLVTVTDTCSLGGLDLLEVSDFEDALAGGDALL